MAKEKVMSRVVEATGASAGALSPTGKELAKKIEAAMTAAIVQANKEGITDPATIKERMMAARAKAKANG